MPKPLIRLAEAAWTPHPPYQDPGLRGALADVYESKDGRFKAVYWEAIGPGRLLERPPIDELICILRGRAMVEHGGEEYEVGPGDVVYWLTADPPVVRVLDTLYAFSVTYDDPDGR